MFSLSLNPISSHMVNLIDTMSLNIWIYLTIYHVLQKNYTYLAFGRTNFPNYLTSKKIQFFFRILVLYIYIPLWVFELSNHKALTLIVIGDYRIKIPHDLKSSLLLILVVLPLKWSRLILKIIFASQIYWPY